MKDYDSASAMASQTIVPVALAVTVALPRDQGRCAMVIVNVGANPVTLSLRGDVAAGQGIRLVAQGSVGRNDLQMTRDDYGRLLDGPIFCIAETGASSLAIWETSEQ